MAKIMPAKHKILRRSARQGAENMVVMAEHQAFAPAFEELFVAGMALADKVSAYFGGREGRQAESCPPPLARFYEQERKKLGANVLKLAAWLWLERALREGDMGAFAVALEKKKLHFSNRAAEADKRDGENALFAELPPGFRALCEEVGHFIRRIIYMDKEAAAARRRPANPVNRQWRRLRHAFGAEK